MPKERYFKSDIVVVYVLSLRKNTKPKLKVFKNLDIDTLIDKKLPRLFARLKLDDYSDYILHIDMKRLPKGVKPTVNMYLGKPQDNKINKKKSNNVAVTNPNLSKWMTAGNINI